MNKELKRKLEIALCSYLPHKVKILRPDGRTILPLIGIEKDSILFDDDGIKYGAFHSSNKLILHPLSDLTKDIEHNGEKFKPIEKMGICIENKEFIKI